MSSCWKCGRDLPEGQVECEDGCAGPELRAPKGLNPDAGCYAGFICDVPLNSQLMDANKLEFFAAQKRFNTLFARAILDSGLVKFVRRNAK